MSENIESITAERDRLLQERDDWKNLHKAAQRAISERNQALNAVTAERDRLHETCKMTGVCMTCLFGAPEPYGCTDCLNTGWEGGSPPNSPEDIEQLFRGMTGDFARLKERAASAEGDQDHLLDTLQTELECLLEDLGTAEQSAVEGLMARINRIEAVIEKAGRS